MNYPPTKLAPLFNTLEVLCLDEISGLYITTEGDLELLSELYNVSVNYVTLLWKKYMAIAKSALTK